MTLSSAAKSRTTTPLLSEKIDAGDETSYSDKQHHSHQTNHPEPLLGVMKRSPMGDYIPAKDEGPLSMLALPTPGPLDYDPKLLQSGVQYSISGKQKQKDTVCGPGPCYNVRSVDLVFNQSPEYSFGKRLAPEKPLMDNPSPAVYDDDHGTFGKDSLKYTVSGWEPIPANENPGPDKYFPTGEFGNAPKYSFGLKPPLIDDPTPGPQYYHSQFGVTQNQSPIYSMRPRVGVAVFTEKEDAFRPGFNEYHPTIPLSQKAASLKGYYKEIKALKTPGPANYIINNASNCAPQPSLTGRNIPYEDEPYYVPPPGPTDYYPNSDPTRCSLPIYSLGSRRTPLPDQRLLVPGPGTHQPTDRQIQHNDAQKVTLKGRWKNKIDCTPGPADYNATWQPTPSLSMTQLARMGPRKTVPDRLKSYIEQSPGPADYKTLQKITKPACPAYTLAKRLNPLKAMSIPGPNAYQAGLKRDGPQISMKSRMSPFVLVFPSNRVDTLKVK